MKITLLPEQSKFTFEFDGIEQDVTFKEIKESDAWKANGVISITHKAISDKGERSVTTLNRDVYLENMKHGDEEYLKAYGLWDLNTSIHKLYALLDGKSEEAADTEIENVSSQRAKLDSLKREWSNEVVEKYSSLETALLEAKTTLEKEKIEKKMAKLKQEKPPFLVSQEMKKLFFAARDESKPEITFANVTPEAVKAAYGDDLIIA